MPSKRYGLERREYHTPSRRPVIKGNAEYQRLMAEAQVQFDKYEAEKGERSRHWYMAPRDPRDV